VTNDKELAEKFRFCAITASTASTIIPRGWNARMDGIQGAVLSVKLKHLDVSNVRRHAHALLYDQLLADTEEIITPFEAPYNRHVYHVYAVRVQERNQILQALADKGISCAIHYPIPVHLQEAYRFLGCDEGSFPGGRTLRGGISFPADVSGIDQGTDSCRGDGTQIVHQRTEARWKNLECRGFESVMGGCSALAFVLQPQD
jgi:dTDP-4-amino-4,6-dideoxygalactose transaminase